MSDQRKVVLGFGSIWGLYALVSLIFGSFTIGSNDSALEIFAFSLYGLTALPSCILAIWLPKYVALWLFVLSALVALGLAYQMLSTTGIAPNTEWASHIAFAIFVVAIPAVLGSLLLKPEGASSAS